MADELKASLNEFTHFAGTLKGDEKSEAQTFLDHFFRALGHKGAMEAFSRRSYEEKKGSALTVATAVLSHPEVQKFVRHHPLIASRAARRLPKADEPTRFAGTPRLAPHRFATVPRHLH
jgi:hypothetical protein